MRMWDAKLYRWAGSAVQISCFIKGSLDSVQGPFHEITGRIYEGTEIADCTPHPGETSTYPPRLVT